MKFFIIFGLTLKLLSFSATANVTSKKVFKIKFYDAMFTLNHTDEFLELSFHNGNIKTVVKKCNRDYVARKMFELIRDLRTYGQVKKKNEEIEVLLNKKKYYVSRTSKLGKNLINIKGIFATIKLTGESLCQK